MLLRIARLALLVEIALYAVLGAWLHATRGWSVAAAVALAAAVLLLVRAGFVAASFAISRAASRRLVPGGRLGPWPSLATFVREWAVVLMNNLVAVPFPRLVMRRDPVPTPTERLPVLLVHGYFAGPGFFAALARRLEAQGVGPVFAPDFPGTFSTIEAFAQALHREIERICAGTGQPRVALVCHSMGGLAARRYLVEHGAARVACLVTIASPHEGTALAAFGPGANARQMRPGSEFLRDLAAREGGALPCPVLSLYTWSDNLVAPQDTSRLAGAREATIDGVAHIAILRSERTFERILEALRAAGVRAGDRA